MFLFMAPWNITSMSLVEKYNVPVPRYTSYPAYPHWNGAPTENEWFSQIELVGKESSSCEVYIHIPFCESLCLYCACNRKITKDHSVENGYIESLIKEWRLYSEKGVRLKVERIHLGGGTPTFLSPKNLDKLLGSLYSLMDRSNNFLGSVELDPRVTSREHIKIFKKYDFKKVSLGIQDFNSNVQKVINRVQPHQLVSRLVEMLKEEGIDQINFDLIYGLPLQTLETIKDTFEKVLKYSPSSIAFYSYAKVPWKFSHQKSLEKYPCKEGREKRDLYNLGRRILKDHEYFDLGLDHFGKSSDILFKSYQQGKMKRNFMGHTDSKATVLIGLGATAISFSGLGYAQNIKNYQEYMEKINSDQLAIFNGHGHTLLDLKVYQAIQDLMSKFETDLSSILLLMDKYSAIKVMEGLELLRGDGLIEMKNGKLKVLDVGRAFVRVVCKAIDCNFHQEFNGGFSKNS